MIRTLLCLTMAALAAVPAAGRSQQQLSRAARAGPPEIDGAIWIPMPALQRVQTIKNIAEFYIKLYDKDQARRIYEFFNVVPIFNEVRHGGVNLPIGIVEVDADVKRYVLPNDPHSVSVTTVTANRIVEFAGMPTDSARSSPSQPPSQEQSIPPVSPTLGDVPEIDAVAYKLMSMAEKVQTIQAVARVYTRRYDRVRANKLVDCFYVIESGHNFPLCITKVDTGVQYYTERQDPHAVSVTTLTAITIIRLVGKPDDSSATRR